MPSALNVMDLTKWTIIVTMCGAVKVTVRLILQGWKLSRVSYALTPSNVSTVEVIIKLILIFISSRSICSTMNGIQKNTKKFMSLENN